MMQVRADDDPLEELGELTIAISERDGVLIIDFGKKISWLGLSKADALLLGHRLMRFGADRYVKLELGDDGA